MKLTELQREVLQQVGSRWLRPMDMGARDGSHHSAVLAALVRKGLVQRVQRGGLAYARGSYLYRLTPQGHAERTNHRSEGSE